MNNEDDILIVDDEIPNLQLLTELLEKEGYQVRPAEKGQMAIDSALAKPPGLILLDVRLPEMDGFEVCRRLKQDKRTEHVPIIFVSVLQDIEARIQGFEAGGVDFISKPYQKLEILARVRTHMHLHRMQQHLEQLVAERTAEIAESEARFSSLVENANETIVVTQGETVTYCNTQVTELSGYTPKEIRAQSFVEFIHPEDREMVLREYQDRLSGKSRTGSYSTRIITKDGQEKHVFISSTLIDWEGKPASLSMITDITELKRIEDELVQAEQRYRTVANFTYDWEWWRDPNGKYIYVSPSCERITGYKQEDFISKKNLIEEIILPDDRNAWDEHDKNAQSEPELREIQFRIKKKNGVIRWIEHACRPITDDEGKFLGVRASNRDISDRKKMQETLKESEGRFRNLMEHSPLSIAIFTPDGKLSQVNTAWKKLWGFSEEETTQVIANYNFRYDKQIESLGLAPLVERGFKGEHIIVPPMDYEGNRTIDDIGLEEIEAHTRWIQVHIYSVKDTNGEIDYVIGIHMDLTELKQAEREAQEQRDMLARINRASSMGQLTGSIAHELNQPLTGILSNAQAAELLIKNGHLDSNELMEITEEIIADTKRAGAVIRNLRELYSEQKGEYFPVDINTVVDETTKLLHSELVKQHVVLTTQCTPPIPLVKGNRIQIQQVLVNLIMNGIQAMQDIVHDDRRIHIKTFHDENEVKVQVEDGGTGIDEDKIDNIFEPLVTWKPGGTGMGLAINHSIIVAHGGRMWAENRTGGGACVGFVLTKLKEGVKT